MNNTLTDGMKLLKALAESGEPKSVKELAECFSWPPSHACRLLKTLVESGYIEQVQKRKYKVGLKVLTLSNAILSRLELRRRLEPFIQRLARESGCQVHLSALTDWTPIIVAVASPEGQSGDSGLAIGALNPVHASASGKVCAAFHPLETLEVFLDGVKFERLASKTITSRKAFESELESVRESKVAMALDERSEGTCAIAAPLFDSAGALAGVVGLYTARPLDEEALGKLRELVASAADAASYALGYPDWRSHKAV